MHLPRLLPLRHQTALSFLTAVSIVVLAGCNQPLETKPLPHPVFDQATLTQLRASHATNINEILAQNQMLNTSMEDRIGRSPYTPVTYLDFTRCWNDPHCHYSITETGIPIQAFPANPIVYDWWLNRFAAPEQAAVCGVRLLDENASHYELASFQNLHELESTTNFTLTHYQQCGSCSTLQDLAVYGSLDLTIMAKTCSKRLGLSNKKQCMQDIGFTEACAESWAYNADKTTQSCLIQCVQEYGLIPLLTGTESSDNTNNGELNQCLQCDEMMAGPGFQYAAGRTRRNSGIESEIERPDEQVYEVEHDYF